MKHQVCNRVHFRPGTPPELVIGKLPETVFNPLKRGAEDVAGFGDKPLRDIGIRSVVVVDAHAPYLILKFSGRKQQMPGTGKFIDMMMGPNKSESTARSRNRLEGKPGRRSGRRRVGDRFRGSGEKHRQ